ncbi:MAG: hypothetical protein KDI79_17145 [Anaerolineae bacterium]|nr:hypothetical protein [Anaerolineae bacterium]
MSRSKSLIKKAIRNVELTVLDQKHKNFMLLRRPRESAIAHTLKLLGDIERDFNNTDLRDRSYFWRRSGFRYVLDAVSHCLRWLAEPPPTRVYLPGASWQQLNREAFDLLAWGMDYAKLAQDHVAWTRGALECNLDETRKMISFEFPANFDTFFLLTQAASEEFYSKRALDEIPSDQLQSGFSAWIDRFTKRLQGVDISWKIERNEKSHQIAFEWLSKTLWPELPAKTDLQGYCLDEFRHFFAALFIHGLYISWAEDYMDKQFGPENEAGSHIVVFSENQMIRWLSEISGVNRSSLRAIVKDLTFDTGNFHSSIVTQPFVKSKSGKLFLLSRLVTILDPMPMIADALHKSKKDEIYAGFVQVLEQSSLDQIEKIFAQLNFRVFREKRFVDADGNKITPDFLLYDPQKKELLVIDYKHTLAPSGASQVIRKSKSLSESREGIRQVQRYLEFFQNNLRLLENWIGEVENKDKINGLLLFRWPMPMHLEFNRQVSIVDWFSLENMLSEENNISIKSLNNWIRTRPDLPYNLKHLQRVPEEVAVDNWTYRRTILAEV